MLRPSPEAGFPEPFALVRSSPRHFVSTALWIALAATMLWIAVTLYGQDHRGPAVAAVGLAGWAALRVLHNFRLLAEDKNLLVLDAGGVTAPRLFAGALPWSAVQGALCGTARGALILRLFVDAKALGKLKARRLTDTRHDQFDLTFSALWLRKSLDFASRSDVQEAASVCNEWVAAEAARFALDDAAVDRARRFAAATRSLVAPPAKSSKAELALAIPAGLAVAVAAVWTIVWFLQN
jgi:hypothetical protein